MKNFFKKDYAPQFNKKLKLKPITPREVYETISLVTVIMFGTYVTLGFLGLL